MDEVVIKGNFSAISSGYQLSINNMGALYFIMDGHKKLPDGSYPISSGSNKPLGQVALKHEAKKTIIEFFCNKE